MSDYVNQKLNVYREFLHGKTASVIGVGISNLPLIDFLLENGVKIVARDKKPLEKLASNPKLDVERLRACGVTFVTGENYLDGIAEQIVFKSPGVRYDKPEILKAYEAGSLITSEMEAFLSLCPAKIIAVTGSNGKTTTTTLIAKILENAGKKVWLGGNIGTPLLPHIAEIRPEDFAVIELSSFQLHTVNRFENAGLPFAKITFPDVGVITNVSPNHLDWHTDMEEYAVSKRAVFTHMAKTGVVVTNRCSDEYTARFAAEASAEGLTVRTFSVYDGVSAHGASMDAERNLLIDGEKLMTADDIRLPGLHNVENYMTAALATKDFVTADAVIKTARSFMGVPHRMELVAERDGTRYFNGSIDSSPSRTAAALSCFGKEYDGRIHIILGGYDKHIPFDALAEPICTKKCRAYITGATAEKITAAIEASPLYNPAETWLIRCADFDAAVRAACAAALPGDVVLLSPACASFDAFDNFEKRGERFRLLVKDFIKASL